MCVETDDPTARRLCGLLERAGIAVSDTMPWNAYPWYVNRPPTTAELRAWVPPLRRLLKALHKVEVVLLLGRHAERSWDQFDAAHPEVTARCQVLRTRHPGRQAFIGTAPQRERWQEEQALVFEQAGVRLR